MTEPPLPELEAERDRLYAQLSAIGDFRRGSVTRSAGSRKTVGRQLAAAEVEKVRREIARYAEFTAAVEQIVEVNERIYEDRPATGTQARVRTPTCAA